MAGIILEPGGNKILSGGITYVMQPGSTWIGCECKFENDKLVHVIFVCVDSVTEMYDVDAYNVYHKYDTETLKFRWVSREEIEHVSNTHKYP